MHADELKKLLASGEKVRIIDVREKKEVEEHGPLVLEGKDEAGNETFKVTAEHIPMGELYAKGVKGEISKGEHIVTVCPAGERCEIVAKELKNRHNFWADHLEGGLKEWKP